MKPSAMFLRVARPRIDRFNAAAEKLAQDAARLESELEAAQVRTPSTGGSENIAAHCLCRSILSELAFFTCRATRVGARFYAAAL